MIERLAADETADAIAVCSGAARGLTNILRFALQMKQHHELVNSRSLQATMTDVPFVKNNFLWQGNIYDLSYFWAKDCDVLPLKTIYQLPQELQIKVKSNINDLVQRGYLELSPDGHYLQLTEAGKQIAYSPEFIEKSVQSTQTTVLQIQKYLEQQYHTSPVATDPTAKATPGSTVIKATEQTTAKAGQKTVAATTVGAAGKSVPQSAAQTAAKATTQTAVAGASTAGVGTVVSIAAEAAKTGYKSLSNLIVK